MLNVEMLPVLPIPMPNTNWELATLALATFSHFHIDIVSIAYQKMMIRPSGAILRTSFPSFSTTDALRPSMAVAVRSTVRFS